MTSNASSGFCLKKSVKTSVSMIESKFSTTSLSAKFFSFKV